MSYVLVPLRWSNQRPFAIRIPTLRQTKMPCPYGDPSATVVSWIVSGLFSFCFHMADEFQCYAGYMQLQYLGPKPWIRTWTIIIILVSYPLKGEIVILYVFYFFQGTLSHYILSLCTRWAPTSYKWSYDPYQWPYMSNWGYDPTYRSYNPFLTGRGPPCSGLRLYTSSTFFFSCFLWPRNMCLAIGNKT